ncbi:MAG: prepilin-type N-terminal cleavage/methylation domain-containing protein [Candidatus Omnitrophota bacterium]
MIKKNRGFTLVETMVVIGIFSFLFAAMYMVLATARNSWLIGEALVEQANSRIGLEYIVNEVRLAGFATIDADTRGIRFSIPVDTDGDGFINLILGTTVAQYGADGQSGWAIKYQIDTDREELVRILLDGAGNEAARRTVARNINPNPTLSFFRTETGGTGVANEAVIISLTTQVDQIQGRTISPPLATTLMTRVNLRNAS